MTLTGRIALITGASRGLGLTIARALGREGARVACMARPGEELERAVATLVSGGTDAIATPADVTREADVAAAVEMAVKRWGGLDIAVLNAGTWQGAPLAQTTESQWDLLVDLNLKGAFLALKHATPHLVARGGGTVVGIDSIGGLAGSSGSGAYAASKWGLRGLLESAALELRRQRVRVSAVFPHNINSAKRAIAADSPERFQNIEPEDVAAVVALICNAPPYVSIGHVTVWPIAAGIGVSMA
jgi:NAD(P)-dependent dehydrogenase (short-subunit alcohol dehydrogenase family)